MLCPNCETENRKEAKFCDQCGFPLAQGKPFATAVESAEADEASGDMFQDDALVPEDDSENEGEEHELVDEQIAEEPDDESIETDYELYQPVESEDTDAIDPAAAAEKLIFAGEEDLLVPVPKREHDLTGFDRHSEEYTERLASIEDKTVEPNFRDGGTMQMPRIEGEDTPKSKDYLASSTKKKSNKKKYVALAIVGVVIVAAIAAFASYQQGIWGGKVIPDVVGMTEVDARTVLVDAGFQTRTEQVKSDDTEGLVLIMDPAANSRADEGSEVVIHVAAARTIPDVVGKTEEEAKAALAEAGYVKVTTKKANSEKKEGSVIDVKPKVGESALSSAEITLTLAQPYTVPDVSGMLFDDAVKALKDAGLGYDVMYIENDNYPEGTIVGTDPAKGATVEKGTYVMIQITQARGAQLEDLVRSQLASGSTIDKNGRSYIVDSLDSVAYLGNDTVSYTATAHEYVYVFGTTVQNQNSESISGTVVFNENNEVVAIS